MMEEEKARREEAQTKMSESSNSGESTERKVVIIQKMEIIFRVLN